jgi:hypothetical protein
VASSAGAGRNDITRLHEVSGLAGAGLSMAGIRQVLAFQEGDCLVSIIAGSGLSAGPDADDVAGGIGDDG